MTRQTAHHGSPITRHASCDVRIGTSGWHYKHWRGPFYPENLSATRMLAWYVERFDTVEINNSFYRLPALETFTAWRDATPAGFCFAVKASRYMTHRKKLHEPEAALERFMPPVEALDGKLGPILFQLPPRWACNLDRLSGLLEVLPKTHRYAFEFRDPSWHVPAVYRLLEKHLAALCLYELDGFLSPIEVTADYVYVRLHGPGRKYQGDYSTAILQSWAERIDRWQAALKAVYVYFDNDQAGFAAKNAAELKTLTGG
ncbi:MAG TPA: DUF72 domain-containing protein [Nitrospiraceae bacterium]|nr:DUF72 domain-containing protein [Nitrospiraceae bacterium]